MASETVSRNLDRDEPAKAELALLDWPFATAAGAGDIADGTRELAADNPDLDAHYAHTESASPEHSRDPGDRVLLAPTPAR